MKIKFNRERSKLKHKIEIEIKKNWVPYYYVHPKRNDLIDSDRE